LIGERILQSGFPLSAARRIGYVLCVPLPQYRFTVERLKEEWSARFARNMMRKRRAR
jgi:hypothetical protein